MGHEGWEVDLGIPSVYDEARRDGGSALKKGAVVCDSAVRPLTVVDGSVRRCISKQVSADEGPVEIYHRKSY